MKADKSEIVRIHDDGAAGKVAAEETPDGNQQVSGSAQAEYSANVKDRSIYGGDKPINLTFPLCFVDICLGYIVFPMVVAVLVPIPVKLLFFSGPLDRTDLLMSLLFCVLCALGVVWLIYSWFVDYYRKRARSITIDPATKMFHVRNFVLTRGKHCLPRFYPELTFALDDVRKVYYHRAASSPVPIDDSGIYIVIPEGYLFVYAGDGLSSALGTTTEFRRMKYFLLVEAEGKNEYTPYGTLDGVLRNWERF